MSRNWFLAIGSSVKRAGVVGIQKNGIEKLRGDLDKYSHVDGCDLSDAGRFGQILNLSNRGRRDQGFGAGAFLDNLKEGDRETQKGKGSDGIASDRVCLMARCEVKRCKTEE